MSKKNKKQNANLNNEYVKINVLDGEGVREAYMLYLAAQGMGITEPTAKDMQTACAIIDKRADEFSTVLDYLTA